MPVTGWATFHRTPYARYTLPFSVSGYAARFPMRGNGVRMMPKNGPDGSRTQPQASMQGRVKTSCICCYVNTRRVSAVQPGVPVHANPRVSTPPRTERFNGVLHGLTRLMIDWNSDHHSLAISGTYKPELPGSALGGSRTRKPCLAMMRTSSALPPIVVTTGIGDRCIP